MEKSIIHAPFDGIVGLRRISVGDYVEAGNDLVNLENIDRIKVDFRLPERYMRVVRTEGAIRITPDALPGKAFDGRIYAIDPQIDPAVRSIAVRALLSNAGRVLRPGMFVRISLIIDRAQKALVVPEEAIVRRGNQQFVFRILKGSAILTPVKLGLRETGRVEVVEGLSVGDTLVTAGHAKLREGSRVDVTRWHDAKS
jgi:membrane fusion protein (multidrug efflux system)